MHERISQETIAIGPPVAARIRAAIYVRMSTEHQQYSIENQTAAMEEYAARHSMDIVKTYTDGGRSGLTLNGRSGLQTLLADTQSGTDEYTDILVLDVTRWGRFLDPDESGHYEFICRRAGYTIHYVKEQFSNDGSVGSALLKSVKRTMAGSYSQELSSKVFAGQCRLIEKGFKQGGPAGYGLRRLMVNERGETKCLLKIGERKSFLTDRVILVPGPPEEIENVNWMYRCFVQEGLRETKIAALLNERGVVTDRGVPWTPATVREVLSNEKYIGNSVYNRRSFKLKRRFVRNPPEQWVRREGAFQGIVDPKLFYAARQILSARCRKWSHEELLAILRRVYEKHGFLTGDLVRKEVGFTMYHTFRKYFGGLTYAYQKIGFDPRFDYSYVPIKRELAARAREMQREIQQRMESLGISVESRGAEGAYVLDGELKICIKVIRYRHRGLGNARWHVTLDTCGEHFTLIIRMGEDHKTPKDYFLLPRIDFDSPSLRFFEVNGVPLDAYRLTDLEGFFRMIRRTNIKEPA